VASDLGREMAKELGVNVEFVLFPHPDKLCDAAKEKKWDIGFIGADPNRAEFFTFTEPYAEL
jgi:ABC-type amino acid transport substrate-binding protein